MMNNVTQSVPFLPPLLFDTAVTIHPAHLNDVQAILEMHHRLSSNSLYLRYLVPYLPDYVAAHVYDICHQPARQGAALVAVHGAQVVGFGYYVVKPGQPDTAEPALLIEDKFQGQGIGGQMFDRLITTARCRGIRFFDALAHSSNRGMLHLLRRSGQPVNSQRDGSHVAILLSLAANGTA